MDIRTMLVVALLVIVPSSLLAAVLLPDHTVTIVGFAGVLSATLLQQIRLEGNAREIVARVAKVEQATNGMKDELVQEVKAAATLAGFAAGEKSEREKNGGSKPH